MEEVVINDCVHLDKIPDAAKNYNVVLAYYVTCIAEGYKRKATEANCNICRSSYRIHACLECAFFGCFEQGSGKVNHMKEHAERNEHFCAININHGYLFCFACGDYIYNEAFEDILDDYLLEANKTMDIPRILPWKPKRKEIELLKGKVKRISNDSYIGLLGVISIGNSCYMNCVIQVFVHCPILRDFFLSDKHRCNMPKDATCLTCEMFLLFQQFYSGISAPYDPTERFNQVLTKFCEAIPGVEQSDCCELYQEILAGMHASYEPKEARQIIDCDCVIHQMFYGTNETLKVCSSCGNQSLLPLDHFTNILLDSEGENDSLVNCLNRKYLQSHLLSDHACQQCQKKDETYLHNSISKLPDVICFQVNCFGFKEIKTKSRKKASKNEKTVPLKITEKKNVPLSFKDVIDMSPYLKSKCSSKDKDPCASLFNEIRYRLFAVIIHEGVLHEGHYKVYVRNRGRWYECNDRLVYSRNFEEVLNCQPSLLFYSKLW